jgi:hypothetical protein
MLLKDKQSDALIEIEDVRTLINPSEHKISGRSQLGEEEQDPEDYPKASLMFPSGESLPRCWVDLDYRHTQVNHLASA